MPRRHTIPPPRGPLGPRLGRLVLVAVTTGGLAVGAGCGAQRNEAAPAGRATAGKIVRIGVISPTTGGLSALGVGIRNAVDLAVRQADAAGRIPGWRIVLAPEDDAANADTGANAATKLSDDHTVMGVVGTLNSDVAEKVAPILDGQKIVMVSPANTNPTLTRGGDPAHPHRPHPYYFRVCTTDAVQGPFAADFVRDDLGLRRVVVVDDQKVYGLGLALAFKARFEARGGRVASVQTVNPDETDFSAVLTRVKQFSPQLVYYGGEYPVASLLTSQAKQQGLDVPFMGGDGIFDPKYIAVAKAAADGDFATSVGAPPDQLPSAAAFVAAYRAAAYPDPFGAYGAYAYDAANVLIGALATVLPTHESLDGAAREGFRAAVAATSFNGVTGRVAFDAFGDTTTRILTVYKVVGGMWASQKTAAFK